MGRTVQVSRGVWDLVVGGPRRAEGRRTLLQRVRWRFVLLNLAVATLAPVSLIGSSGGAWARVAALLAAMAALATWAVALYRTVGRHPLLDVVGPVLVVGIGVAAGGHGWAIGPMVVAVLLHSFYGRRRRVLRNAVLYAVAHAVTVVASEEATGALGGHLATSTVAVVFIAWVMQELAASLRRNDTARDREHTLTQFGSHLLRASDPQQVNDVIVACVAELAAPAGSHRVTVWWRDDDGLRLAASSGEPSKADRIVIAAISHGPGDGHPPSRPVRLDPERLREAQRASGATELLGHGLAVPLSDGDAPHGVVLVETATSLDDDVVIAMQRFGNEVLLAERAVRRNRLLAGVLHNSADGIVLVDVAGRLTFVSPAVTELAGRPVVAGEPLGGLLATTRGEDVSGVACPAELEHNTSVVLCQADGGLLDVEVSARVVVGEGTVLNIRDVSEQRRLQAEISYRAFFDPVTELPNRGLFLDRLDHALARAVRDGSHVAVALIDLDDFKAVNDRWGHLSGDRLLRHVAGQAVGRVRASDTVARIGGDEFALLLEGLHESSDPVDCLAHVLAAVRRPLEVDGHRLTTSASGGIAISDGAHSAEQLLGEADMAMYAAKELGKNVAVTFHAGLRVDADDRRELQDGLEASIERDELRLLYQPIVSLADGATVGVEALVRWQHPTRGLLVPDQFIPLAEESGLVVPLGRWVLATACRDLARWKARGFVDERFKVNVNLSVCQLADKGVVADVEDALETFSLDPAHLVVEVTETALADNPDLAEETLWRLHRLGVGVAIDDFGTGYASFTYLRRFPVDIIKIDHDFVTDITEGHEQTAIAHAITRLARSLRMTTVAEGVESAEQRALLTDLDCDQAQGWLWSPALRGDQLESWVAGTAGVRDPRRRGAHVVPAGRPWGSSRRDH
jgi:diguanylate cyclase (GGDEF)-like protein